MNPRLLDLALHKQRLQIRAQGERRDMAARLGGIGDALDQVDRLRDAAAWLRDNAPIVSSVVIGLVVLKPRGVLRWLRRAIIGWQIYARARVMLAGVKRSGTALRTPRARRQ